jgi:hypothetical protein
MSICGYWRIAGREHQWGPQSEPTRVRRRPTTMQITVAALVLLTAGQLLVAGCGAAEVHTTEAAEWRAAYSGASRP